MSIKFIEQTRAIHAASYCARRAIPSHLVHCAAIKTLTACYKINGNCGPLRLMISTVLQDVLALFTV